MEQKEKERNFRLRYLFEHRILPGWVYRDTEGFVESLLEQREYLYGIAKEFYLENHAELPYGPEEFSLETIMEGDGRIVLKLDFPFPEQMPLCYHAYLFFDKKLEKIDYYSIEKSGIDEKEAVLCGWKQDGSHMNYGKLDLKDAFNRCMELYEEKVLAR